MSIRLSATRPGRARAALLLATTLAACTSATTPAAGTGSMLVSQSALGNDANGRADGRVVRSVTEERLTLPGTPDVGYGVLGRAFEYLGLEVTQADAGARQMATVEQRVRRTLGAERLSTYLTCGRNALGGDNADVYDVRLTVLSALAPAPDGTGTVLSARVTAQGRPMAVTGDAVTCESTGALERRLAAQMAELLRGSR